MTAFAEGEEIQSLQHGRVWVTDNDPTWNQEVEYRIKVKPKGTPVE